MQGLRRDRLPKHVAVIMDGNGRWAERRGLPRTAGHRAGARAVRRITEAAVREQLGALTLYAFSCDNWQRPRAEVDALMALLGRFLRAERARLVHEGVRMSVIGRRDRLPPLLCAAIADVEAATAAGAALHLRLAVDYSGRDAITRGEVVPDVDLLIRTGGEHRLSDFLLWESAYAELVFSPTMWPDFTPADFATALREFRTRSRRFGALEERAS
jgi:undecaprenyl diphosphate synthase